MIDDDKLRELASMWKAEAIRRVPEDYASRGLQSKYLKLDNEAAGLDSCADELLELLDSAAQLQRAADASAATEACPAKEHHDTFAESGHNYCCYCGERLLPQTAGRA